MSKFKIVRKDGFEPLTFQITVTSEFELIAWLDLLIQTEEAHGEAGVMAYEYLLDSKYE